MTEHGCEAVGYVCVTIIVLALIACAETCVIVKNPGVTTPSPAPTAEHTPAVPR